ncbi:MAG: MarR family transcriptional regulator [Anaerolineae bacterium]|nr:MarR family transcriptional regulator [Anaerolineae bacterium]
MDLPFHLKALPPEALDVLRYFGTLNDPVAHAMKITDEVGLSDRTFGKVIRRLVTKGYLQMDGDQAYRLSENGQDAVDELLEYDAEFPADKAARQAPVEEKVSRKMVLVVPKTLQSGAATTFHVGFNPADDEQILEDMAEVVIRVSLVNAEPARPQESTINVQNKAVYKSFTVTAGTLDKARIKIQAFQLGPNPDDIAVAGGMYVDLDVTSAAGAPQVAFTVDVSINKQVD